MPSCVVHNYFAKKVLEGLNPEIKEIISKHEQPYLVGSQGPDLMFYLRYEQKPLNELGMIQHQSFNAYEVFKASGGYARGLEDDTVSAFLFGQLCHYAIDKNIHPYVYHREKDLPGYYTKGARKYIHVVFESALDYICIRDFIKGNTRTFKAEISIFRRSAERNWKYYSEILAPLFNMKMSVEQGEKDDKADRKFMKICDDTTGIKYIIIRGIEKLLGKQEGMPALYGPRRERPDEDWMNIKALSEKQEFNRTRNYTVEEMAKNAYNDALALISNLYDYIKSDKALEKKLYLNNYAGDIK